MEKDPIEKHNLVKDKAYAKVREELKQQLIDEMMNAGESKPIIMPAYKARRI